MADRVVTLNVGGTFFTSKFSTLTKYSSSKLASMVVERETQEVDDGTSLFIDRDPTLFRLILNCLRLGRVLLPDNFNEMAMLKEEMTYFELYDLASHLSTVPPEATTTASRTSSMAAATCAPSKNGQDFIYVRCQPKAINIYTEWVFESTESICQEIAKSLTKKYQRLEKPKHLKSGAAYRHSQPIHVAIFSQMMADLGFAESSRFDRFDDRKLHRMFIRPR